MFRCCNAKVLSARSSPQPENGDLALPSQSYVELKDLQIAARIGTYGADDVVPDAHLLDLALTIAPDLVLIARDEMAMVLDYDPLIRQIDALALTSHFETQERLMTRIVEACTDYPQIEALDVCLPKRPVRDRDAWCAVDYRCRRDGRAAPRRGMSLPTALQFHGTLQTTVANFRVSAMPRPNHRGDQIGHGDGSVQGVYRGYV
jgi:dihydroneopterin aldolase